MYTLSEFNAMQSEVAELKAENKRLNKQLTMVAKFYDGFYKGRIKSLTECRDKIQNKHCQLKKKIKNKKVIPKNIVKAKVMLWDRVIGNSTLTNTEIAAVCFSSLGKVRKLSIEVNNEKLQVNC